MPTNRLRDKAELRATLSGLFLIDGALRTAGLAAQDTRRP